MAEFWGNLKRAVAREELDALEKEIAALKRRLEGAETLEQEAMGAAEAWRHEAEKAQAAYAQEKQERWRLSQECDEWERRCLALEKEKEELVQQCSQLKEQLKMQAEELERSMGAKAGEVNAGHEETEEERRMRELLKTEIRECHFPVRVEKAVLLFLDRVDATLDDLCSRRMSELLKVRQFGEVSANQLNYGLREMGLSLAAENSEMMQTRIDKILRPSQAHFVKLADLDLSASTYDMLTSKGYETVADVIVCRGFMVWSKDRVCESFDQRRAANEFLKKIAAYGFVLD